MGIFSTGQKCQFLKSSGGFFSGEKKCAILGTSIPEVRLAKYCESDFFACEIFQKGMTEK